METSQIISIILKAEMESGVFNLKHKKINTIWPFYRMYFFYSFLKEKSNIGEIGVSARKINLSSIWKNVKLLKYSRIIQLLIPKRKSNIIISSQRYLNGEEVYTKDIKAIIKNDFLELSFSNRFEFQKGPIYLDSVKIVLKIISYISYHFFKTPREVSVFLSKVEANKLLKNQYKRYRIEYSYWYVFYKLMLKIQKPKRIFVVGGVYFAPLIAVAEKHKIEVIEIQHGVINNFHLAYHFPNQSRNTFFPHKLLLFSDYWKTKANYPLGTELITVGNDFYCPKTDTIKQKHSILIIGDGILYDKLISFINLNLNFFVKNNYEITYKLHPSEVLEWEKRYVLLKELNDTNKIKVIANEPAITSLLDQSEIVIGCNSTSIYESLERNCKTFVLKLQSSEYFDDLVEKKMVQLLNPHIPLCVDDLDFSPKVSMKFFDPSSLTKISALVFD
jgi:hypothetical protein